MSGIFDDLTDTELGQMMRKVGRAIEGLSGPDGMKPEIGFVAGAAHILVRHAAASNAGRLTVRLDDVESDGEKLGDWIVEVRAPTPGQDPRNPWARRKWSTAWPISRTAGPSPASGS